MILINNFLRSYHNRFIKNYSTIDSFNVQLNNLLKQKLQQSQNITIESSQQLTNLVFRRLTSRQCDGLINTLRSSDIKSKRFDIVKKYDKWLSRHIMKVISSTNKESLYPLTIPPLFNDSVYEITSKLALCLYTARNSVEVVSFNNVIDDLSTNNQIDSENSKNDLEEASDKKEQMDIIQKTVELAIKLVTSAPTKIINELIQVLEMYRSEGLASQSLPTRFAIILNLHNDHFDDLLEYFDIVKSVDVKFKIELSKNRKLLLCDELRREIDKLAITDNNVNSSTLPNMISSYKINRLGFKQKCLKVNVKFMGSSYYNNQISSYDNENDETYSDLSYGISTKRKIFIGNIPSGVSETSLEHAMRNIGNIQKIWLYQVKEESVTTTSVESNTTINESEQIYQEIIKISGNTPPPRHPVSSFASMEIDKYSAKKKSVAKNERYDNHAFVLFKDDISYKRALREDMRVLGFFLQGEVCRTVPSERITSIVIECTRMLSVDDIDKFFSSIILPGLSINFSKDATGDLKPVFVIIQFENHESAWMMYDIFQKEFQRGMPFRPSWTLTKWYYQVAEKDKKLRIEKISNEIIAKNIDIDNL